MENKYYKRRDLIPTLVAVVALFVHFFLNKEPAYIYWVGVIVGQALRIWSRIHVGNHTRMMNLNVPELVVTGSYRFSRNPLYVSNLIVSTSLILSLNLTSVEVIPLIMLLIWNWKKVIEEEEVYLSEEFGSSYDDYFKSVSRWFDINEVILLLRSIKSRMLSQIEHIDVPVDRGNQFRLNSWIQSIYSDKWTWIWQYLILSIILVADLTLNLI